MLTRQAPRRGLVSLRCQRSADHALPRSLNDARAGIDMPSSALARTVATILARSACGRVTHVARATCHIVEHKGLVAAVQKRKRHGILLMRSDMRKRTSPDANNHGSGAIRLIGKQRLGTKYVNVAGYCLGRLHRPTAHGSRQSYVLPSRRLCAHGFSLMYFPLEPVAKKHSSNKFPFN